MEENRKRFSNIIKTVQRFYTLTFDCKSKISHCHAVTIFHFLLEKISLTEGQFHDYCFSNFEFDKQ